MSARSVRFVPVKTTEQQSTLTGYRARALVGRQRRVAANALRAPAYSTGDLVTALIERTRRFLGQNLH